MASQQLVLDLLRRVYDLIRELLHNLLASVPAVQQLLEGGQVVELRDRKFRVLKQVTVCDARPLPVCMQMDTAALSACTTATPSCSGPWPRRVPNAARRARCAQDSEPLRALRCCANSTPPPLPAE